MNIDAIKKKINESVLKEYSFLSPAKGDFYKTILPELKKHFLVDADSPFITLKLKI